MSRSVWKGPFVEQSLIKKVDKQKDNPSKKPIKTWSRKSTIIPDFVGTEKNLYQSQCLRIWLGTNLASLLQQDNSLGIHLPIKKLKLRKVQKLERKNSIYEERYK